MSFVGYHLIGCAEIEWLLRDDPIERKIEIVDEQFSVKNFHKNFQKIANSFEFFKHLMRLVVENLWYQNQAKNALGSTLCASPAWEWVRTFTMTLPG